MRVRSKSNLNMHEYEDEDEDADDNEDEQQPGGRLALGVARAEAYLDSLRNSD